ncbi:serine O-acetyltransferase [Halodesulfurarchaeum formicicum]|uniref:serine O-acetyltransferase n=1 Tax=Halodesulfurarchaeum formicicum TaxID=1873524 RepID=A0A1D8S254_9EURY|nr:serine O-acetyltransferase EpsC [Halodesulfurarchaeum formicicum]AOW79439.1 serine O-acetyltransferase [Halodesulfurarchaeum formicicum]
MSYRYTGDTHRALVASYRADEAPFPTETDLVAPERNHARREIALLKCLLFPRLWNSGDNVGDPDAVQKCLSELGELFATGFRLYGESDPAPLVTTVLDQMPEIRDTLKRDVVAAYKGDPAAKSYREVIRSYPGFQALLVHRVAHVLYEAGAEEYARELSECAKTETGIDIHPGAEIGEYCLIDHGTGVVIGETATVGDWARIYQNVTLGALHFEEAENEEHMLRKGYKRHPDIGDHVVIGAGSNIMGPVEVGDHVSIGANSWISEDVPDHTVVFIADHPDLEQKPTD